MFFVKLNINNYSFEITVDFIPSDYIILLKGAIIFSTINKTNNFVQISILMFKVVQENDLPNHLNFIM